MKKYVIIGNSATGLTVAKKLRDLDAASEIICISQEQELPYNKCKLANYLAGDASVESILVSSEKVLLEKNISLMLNTRVEKILSDNNKILLSSKGSKNELCYDKLLIATGARPIIPNITGIQKGGRLSRGVFTFYTLEDVYNILAFIENYKPRNAVIIGAGMTGVECADALVKKGLHVSIIEKGSHILTHCCDKSSAEYIEKLMGVYGVDVYCSEGVKEVIWENKHISYVVLGSGKFILADMVIVVVGVKPNIALAREAGVEIGDFGIVTDAYMRTNVKNIYAGGDVAQVKDFVSHQDMRSCTWKDACDQGIVAACSMAEVKEKKKEKKINDTRTCEPYKGALPFSVSHFWTIAFASYITALCHKAKYEECIRFGDNFFYKILLENGFVRGFLLIGDIKPLGMLYKMILSKQKFDKKKLEL